MQKINIVFFVDTLRENFDGMANTMFQIIAHIPPDRINPLFISPLPPINEDFPYPVLKCPSFDLPLYKGYQVAVPQLMKNLEKTLNDFQPHIIHWSTPSILGWYAISYAKKNRLPSVTIYHTHFTSYVEYYLSFIPGINKLTPPIAKNFLSLYKKTDLVLAPTESMKKYLRSIDVMDEQIKIWGRGVNANKFNPEFKDSTYFEKYGVDAKAYKILFVSRLTSYKETDTLARLNKLFVGTHFKLILVGDGPEREKMERQMQNAVFTGKLVGEELSKAFASADIFVFPSITETFGNVVLEAMSSGLPVIAADSGGPSDIIKNGKTGFLVPPKNENIFFEKCELLMSDSNLYNTIKDQALLYAQEQNWQLLCDQLFEYYDDMNLESK